MIKPTDNYLNQLELNVITPKSKIVVDGVEYLGNIIKEAPKIKHSSTKYVGTFPTKSASFTIYDFDNSLDFRDKEIEIYKGIIVNGEAEYLKQGVFIPRADNITTNISERTVTFDSVQDKTQLLENKYVSSLDWSNDKKHSGLEIIQEICTRNKITLKNTNFAFSKYMFKQPNFNETITDRGVISAMAEIGGEIAIFDCQGELEIKKKNKIDYLLKRNRYVKLSYEKVIVINSVVLGKEGMDNDIVYPESIETERVDIKILDNPFVDLYRQEMIEEVAKHIIGLTFIPYELTDAVDGYMYELNDSIDVIDKNGNQFEAIILDIQNNSRIKSTVKAPKFENSKTNYSLAGSNKQDLSEVKLTVDHINKNVESLAKEVSEDSERITKVEQSASSITQKVESTEKNVKELADSIEVFSVDLSNYNLVISTDINNKPFQNGTYEIPFYAYYKGKQITPKVTVEEKQSGVTVETDNTKITFKVTNDTIITNKNYIYNISFEYSDDTGITYTTTKKISMALATQGNDGADGKDAVTPKTLDEATGKVLNIEASNYSPLELTIDGAYKQETSEQSKNLYNYKDTADVSSGATADLDGWITMTYDNSSGSSIHYLRYWPNNLKLKANTQYNVIVEIKNVTGTGTISPVSNPGGTAGQFTPTWPFNFSDLSNNQIIRGIRTTKSTNFENMTRGLCTQTAFQAGESGSITFRISVLEDLLVTPDTFQYEPFIPDSPSPDYPSDIEVIEGNDIKIKQFDKNILNYNSGYHNYFTNYFAFVINVPEYTLKAGKTYYFTVDVFCTNSKKVNGINFYPNTKSTDYVNTSIFNPSLTNSYQRYIRTITPNKDLTLTSISVQSQQAATNAELIFKNFMISEENIAYIPYQEKIYSINLKKINLFENKFNAKYDNLKWSYNITTDELLSTLNSLQEGNYNVSFDWKLVSVTSDLVASDFSSIRFHGTGISSVQVDIKIPYFTVNDTTVNIKSTFSISKEQVGKFTTIMLYGVGNNSNGAKGTANISNIIVSQGSIYDNFVGALPDGTRDYVKSDGKKYWLEKNIGKYIITGNENWSYRESDKLIALNGFPGKHPSDDSVKAELLCTHFKPSARTNQKDGEISINTSGNLCILNNISSVDNFKNWLKEQCNNGTPVIAYYALATSEIIDLGEEPKIELVDGINNISVVANLDTNLYMKYYTIYKGSPGQQGSQGIQGPKGEDGKSTYFYVRYSKNSTGNPMVISPTSETEYMGVATTTSPTAPTSYSAYTWSKIKGDTGTQGIQGPPGSNGKSSYLHIKYSEDGKTFTPATESVPIGETPAKWQGTYVDDNPTDSDNFNDYKWNDTSVYVQEDLKHLQEGIDQANADITNVGTDLKNNYLTSEEVNALQKHNEESLNNLKEEFTSLVQTQNEVQIQVGSIISDGVNKIKTATGYTFDENGLDISKEGSEIHNTIDNLGMFVKRDDEELLGVDTTGVRTENLTVRKYLIMGKNSRFEDYKSNRTGCFYVGS